MEMREVRQAALLRLAKINMDQAIQIATSQQPGKVLFAVSTQKVGKNPANWLKTESCSTASSSRMKQPGRDARLGERSRRHDHQDRKGIAAKARTIV
jgi:hypothetical protein